MAGGLIPDASCNLAAGTTPGLAAPLPEACFARGEGRKTEPVGSGAFCTRSSFNRVFWLFPSVRFRQRLSVEQRNHEPQGFNFPLHAGTIQFFLPQNLVDIFHRSTPLKAARIKNARSSE